MNPPRVLLSAYQCGPGMGSVSQIGWDWYRRLAARTPVTLVTHVRNREALDRAGAPLPGSEVVYIDTEWFAGPLYRFAKRLFRNAEHPVFLVSSLDYYVYDWVAVRQLRPRQRAERCWDIVHQPTPVSPLASTRLYTLGLPLVLGPWNGGLKSPENFPEIMQAESGWLYSVRRLGKLVDWVLGATRHAKVILTATASTLADLPNRCRPRSRFLLENGVDLNLFRPAPWPEPPSSNNPLQVLFVGRLIPVKGVVMLLEALVELKQRLPIRLTVVGSGPEEAALHAQAAALNLGDCVHFTGNLPLADVAVEMAKAHVFCLPSVRESGGAVLLEAMAAGRPVVAVDYGGPSEIVDDGVGALLPPTGRAAVVEGLVRTLADVMANPETWRLKGEAGRRRVEERYSWEAKVDAALGIYRECLG